MILGLNLSHDSSAALLEDDGRVIAAIAEERLSRRKGHIGIPVLAIDALAKIAGRSPIKMIIVGHADWTFEHAYTFKAHLLKNPSNRLGSWDQVHPGFVNSFKFPGQNPLEIIRTIIHSFVLKSFEITYKPEIVFIKHHKAHLGSTLGFQSEADSLCFSLDGEGDGESGSIAIGSKSGKLITLSNISDLDSLGNLYTAVTKRYNFKPTQHEGKITGLAAFGKSSAAVTILMEHVKVKNGSVSIKYAKNLKQKATSKAISQIFGLKGAPTSLDEIISIAESQTLNYPDLAFAIQKVLEDSVIEIVNYWIQKTNISDINLTGGVFANVKLNQRVSEISRVNLVRVFPNMGDGGVALGSAWAYLAENNLLSKEALYTDMYLGTPNTEDEDLTSFYFEEKGLNVEVFEDEKLPKEVAKLLAVGQIVAIHQNRMEFGPRALGNRSLLADPRDRRIMETLNQRLNRTEFMPFAPMVMDSFFTEYFSTRNLSLQPFEYMAMTCEVNEKYQRLIPAVTHIDGTARPQIVTMGGNPLIYKILHHFFLATGIPVLVNTSLNIHEEPINNQMSDSIAGLEKSAFDFLVFKNMLISKDSSKRG